MKRTLTALILGAATLSAGAASAGGGYWNKHGKVCFHNKWGYVQCVNKNKFYKPNHVYGGHKPYVVIKNPHGHFYAPKRYGY